MKIVVVGGTGTIGKAVVKELSTQHTIITAGLSDGDIQVDITNSHSIEQLYKKLGKIDAIIATTGSVHFAPLHQMTTQDYYTGLHSKLMGQVNLVLQGLNYLNDHGSFTLTSGILNHDPIVTGSSAAMVNGALDGFVKAAALEMPRGIRINCVSPTVIQESMSIYADYFPGYIPVPVAQVAMAYKKSIQGAQTGQVYKVGYI